jgi:signal transduction histidine kinase
MESTQELSFLTALLPLAGVVFIIAFGVILLNQHFRKNLAQQKLKQEELKTLHHKELLRSAIDTQEAERKRIANDLHDELGAVLSIARMHLIQLEEKSTAPDGNLLAALQNVRTLTESALASMRRISHELMPPQLETFGIVKTLEALANRINSTNGIHIEVSAGEWPPLSLSIQLGLYRICLELITNTIKHANATQITIRIASDASQLSMDYHDNGKGQHSSPVRSGLGTNSLEARVSALSGKITSNHIGESGFNFKLEIPLTL